MRYSKEYYLKEILPNLSKERYVMCGVSALCYIGISHIGLYVPDLLMKHKQFDGLIIGNKVAYWYAENIDYEHYVTPMKEAPLVLMPTIERAVVETVKHDLKFVDEGYFLESLKDYYLSPCFNEPLLREVSKFFEVDYGQVEYWLNECIYS